MQDLRDKLLRAGLVDKQQARQSKTDKRRKKKRRGGARAEQQQEQARRQQFESRKAEQAERSRALQDELNRQRAEAERQHQIRDLIRAHTLAPDRRRQPERPFYFVGRDRRIRRLHVGYELASKLSVGAAAVVETDRDAGGADHAIVDRACAERLAQLGPELLLFWHRDGDDDAVLPTFGSGS